MIAIPRRAAMLGGLSALALPSIARAATRVRIGYQKNGSLVLLRQQKRLDALGWAIEWVEFTSGPPLLEALNAGAIDFGATGDTPPIFAQAAGAELVYVAGQPIEGRNQAVLVRADSPIRTLADLKGKRVAFTKGSSAHNVTVQALRSVGLKISDIQHVNMQPADAGAAFRAGAVDAWTIWDPFYAMAELEPTTRVLTNAVGIAPSNSFFLARRAFADREAGAVMTLLAKINEAAEWAKTNPEALSGIMAEVTGVPIAAQRVAAPRGIYTALPMDAAIVARQQAIADLFAELRIIPARIDVNAVVWQAARPHAEAKP